MDNISKKTVVVGMSGGVDSSVAALLLKEQGYNVIGVTMQIWQNDQAIIEDTGGCCGLSAVDDARRVAKKLDIPFYVMNFREIFKEKVIDYFARAYKNGETPNPCIACNRYVKWESLLLRSRGIGADYIATGHYAQVIRLKNGRYALKQSVTKKKDQTYALYNLTQDQLSMTLMPVGVYNKDEIRSMAESINLRIANKPDSQDICFVPDGKYTEFLEDYTGAKMQTGNFVDEEGNILGEHKGINCYTIGQRKGLGISLGKQVFVTEIRPKTNEVVLGDNKDTFAFALIAKDLSFMPFEKLEGEQKFTAKIRYAHNPAICTAKMIDTDKMEVRFEEAQRAITPGQAIVLYDSDMVVGGGTIVSKINS